MTTNYTTYYLRSDITTSGALTHRYYVQDYLGSTRAVVDEDGNVLQSTAYYPSGVPLTPNSLTPQTIKLHTGKDFFDLQGVGWYDNNARYYDPILARFTTQDPLAEKYPWLSPYVHCSNNPINKIDPNGTDEWEINSLGVIINKKNTNKHDLFYIVNGDSQKSLSFKYGMIINDLDKITQNGTKYYMYMIRGDKNSTKLFEFLSQETNVEWSLAQTGISGDKGLGFLTTSYATNYEAGMTNLINTQLKYNYTLRNLYHNHPNNTSYPSGLYDEDGDGIISGDIPFAKMVQSLFKKEINFEIYLPQDNKYINYLPNSTFEDFEDNILHGYKLDELIVTP